MVKRETVEHSVVTANPVPVTASRIGHRPRVAVLMTCFNRRATTLAALRAVYASHDLDAVDLAIYLVDDGSTDGTGEAVGKAYPAVHVIGGSGNLYWNGGMRLAWQTALQTPHDFFLWLNDDLELQPETIVGLVRHWQARAEHYRERLILVGRTVSLTTGTPTYGGYVRASRLSRLRFRLTDRPDAPCDTMNGNCVFIPAIAAAEVGIHSPHYRHAFGDNDYGLRARERGYTILEHDKVVGFQEPNHAYAKSSSHLTWKNWRFVFFHPKGMPLREWSAFCRAHGGWLWPINLMVRYLKMI